MRQNMTMLVMIVQSRMTISTNAKSIRCDPKKQKRPGEVKAELHSEDRKDLTRHFEWSKSPYSPSRDAHADIECGTNGREHQSGELNRGFSRT
jgi:hypothetical protein